VAGLLIGVFAGLALIPSLMFVVSYGARARKWRVYPEGWYLFLKSLLFVAVYGSFLLGRIVDGLGLVYWAFLMAGLAVAQWALLFLYVRTRRQIVRGEVCPSCGGVPLGPLQGNTKH
jgi:hypothetical protein